MSTAEELSAAMRPVPAHEAHLATLMSRIDEMRHHLDQAGVRSHAAETQLRAGMNASGYVKFTLGKERCCLTTSTVRIACSSQTGSSRCQTS